MPVKESRKSCLVNLRACSSFYQTGLSNMNYFTGFAKTLYFLNLCTDIFKEHVVANSIDW